MASCFRQVLIGSTNAREELVLALGLPFPDVSPHSQFSADIMGIRGAGRLPACLPVDAPTVRRTPSGQGPTASATPKAIPTTPTPSSAPAPPPAAPLSSKPTAPFPAAKTSAKTPLGKVASPLPTPRRKQLCGFYNTVEGCAKSDFECRHDHRDVASKDERDYMKQFLKRYPDRHAKGRGAVVTVATAPPLLPSPPIPTRPVVFDPGGDGEEVEQVTKHASLAWQDLAATIDLLARSLLSQPIMGMRDDLPHLVDDILS